jgi:hypothetical protein
MVGVGKVPGFGDSFLLRARTPEKKLVMNEINDKIYHSRVSRGALDKSSGSSSRWISSVGNGRTAGPLLGVGEALGTLMVPPIGFEGVFAAG